MQEFGQSLATELLKSRALEMDKGKDKFMNYFAHLFNDYLLSWSYVPSPVLVPKASVVNEIQPLRRDDMLLRGIKT